MPGEGMGNPPGFNPRGVGPGNPPGYNPPGEGMRNPQGARPWDRPGMNPPGTGPGNPPGMGRPPMRGADWKENTADRREDVMDRKEDVWDAQHQGGKKDKIEDIKKEREEFIFKEISVAMKKINVMV